MRTGLNYSGHLRIIFIGESAVDDGGPLREFFYLLMKALAQNDMIFCGPAELRMPRHSVVELQKKTFYYVGVIIALSVVHGGPAPQFLSSAVADYLIFGPLGVKATSSDIVDNPEKRENVQKVQK